MFSLGGLDWLSHVDAILHPSVNVTSTEQPGLQSMSVPITCVIHIFSTYSVLPYYHKHHLEMSSLKRRKFFSLPPSCITGYEIVVGSWIMYSKCFYEATNFYKCLGGLEVSPSLGIDALLQIQNNTNIHTLDELSSYSFIVLPYVRIELINDSIKLSEGTRMQSAAQLITTPGKSGVPFCEWQVSQLSLLDA